MRIAVLVKQVPATDKAKMDEETGTIVRSVMEAELNPLDVYAVEKAVRIKEQKGEDVKVTVILTSPPVAKDAVAMGYGRGVGNGEQGIGIEKRSIFLNVESKIKASLIRNIKRVFDPNLVLNPEKSYKEEDSGKSFSNKSWRYFDKSCLF